MGRPRSRASRPPVPPRLRAPRGGRREGRAGRGRDGGALDVEPRGAPDRGTAGRARVRRAALLVAFLTLLVWGLFGLDHGLFHDDASLLFVAQRGASHAFGALFEPSGAPTRLLQTLPYAVAWATAAPTLVLQLWYGAAWVATALLVYALARSLAPGAPIVPLVACALAASGTIGAPGARLRASAYTRRAVATHAAPYQSCRTSVGAAVAQATAYGSVWRRRVGAPEGSK